MLFNGQELEISNHSIGCGDDEIKRFLSKLVVSGDCWIYSGGKNSAGYGYFGFNSADGRSVWSAHRFSYTAFVGDIPSGLIILHSCDVCPCCNPSHLSAGTHMDNAHDKLRKGRQGNVCGELHHQTNLKYEDVKVIRHLYFAERRSQDEIARFFGIKQCAVSKITRKKSWVKNKWATQ